jgi:hypothetical protein
MPLGPGVRYRVKTNPDGSKVRLAFRGDDVIEAKKLEAQGRGLKKMSKKEA